MPYETEPPRRSLVGSVTSGILIFMVVGSITLGYFFWASGQGPGIVETILIGGFVLLCAIAALRGIIARFEAETPMLVTGSGTFRLANPEGYTVKVEVTSASVDFLRSNGVTIPADARLSPDGRYLRATDGSNLEVALTLRLLGGLKKKTWWVNTPGGELGALMTWGDGEMFSVQEGKGTGFVLPRTLIRCLPSAVPHEVATLLKDPRYKGDFVYGDCPIYRPGSMAPEYIHYIQRNKAPIQSWIAKADPSIPQQSHEDVYNLITRNLLLQAQVGSLTKQVDSQQLRIQNLDAENEMLTRTRAKVAHAYTDRSGAEIIADKSRGITYESSGSGNRSG
jgi:hypothetical protein